MTHELKIAWCILKSPTVTTFNLNSHIARKTWQRVMVKLNFIAGELYMTLHILLYFCFLGRKNKMRVGVAVGE